MVESQRLEQLQDVGLVGVELLETVGVGTFGRVRLCRVKGESAVFALKMMKKSILLKYKQVAHVKSEKSVTSLVKGPYIARVHSSFQTDRWICFLTEFVQGGELFRRLRDEGEFSESVARFYASEVVHTFGYLHDLSIVYRDLKPENLLIAADGHLKFIDFGFAKIVQEKTFTLCGTPEYLSPEAIERKGQTTAVDWWALGVLIYEMLVGHPPFTDSNPYRLYEKIIAGRFLMPETLSSKAKDIIEELLQPDTSKRLGSTVTSTQRDADSVKHHPWFQGVDFQDVASKRVQAPWRPDIVAGDDSSLFEKYPDSEEAEPVRLYRGVDPFVDF